MEQKIVWKWHKKDDYYFAEINGVMRPNLRANLIEGEMCVYGGDFGTSIEQPSPPQQPSTEEAINAYISGLPAMYEAQMEYSPLITGQQIGMLQQYLPEVTALQQNLQQQYLPQNVAQQVGLQMAYAPVLAQQQRQLQELYQPESLAATQALGGIVNQDYLSQTDLGQMSPLLGQVSEQAQTMMNEGLSDDEMSLYRDLYASNIGTNAGSPIGADYMSSNLLAQDIARRDLGRQLATQLGQTGLSETGRRQNVGLSMAGMYNVPSQPQIGMQGINIPGLQTANVMSGYTFPNVANFMNQGYGNYMGGYSSMYGTNAGLAGQNTGLMGNILGGVLGGLGSMSSARYKKNIKLWN